MSLQTPHSPSGEVLPLRHPVRRRRRGPLTGPQAEVFDLALERQKRIPDEVLEAMAQADALWHELEAAGLRIHFDLGEDGVSAVLSDDDGSVRRKLSLVEAVDPPDLLPPDAA